MFIPAKGAGVMQEKIIKTRYNFTVETLNLTAALDSSSDVNSYQADEQMSENYLDSQFLVFFNRLFCSILAGFMLLFQGQTRSRWLSLYVSSYSESAF